MAMSITGAQFTWLPMLKLETLLDAANSKSPSNAAGRKEVPLLKTADSNESSSEESLANCIGKSGTGTSEIALLTRSFDGLHGTNKAQGQQAVFTLLSEISGAPVNTIGDKQNLN